jgi:hypothetical protein
MQSWPGLKKADALRKLSGLRRATLILGRFGISADRIEGMTVSELTPGLMTSTGCMAGSRQPVHLIKSRRKKRGKGKCVHYSLP